MNTKNNVITMANYGDKLDLDKLSFAVSNLEYEPATTPWLTWRFFAKEGQVVAQLFSNGKIIFIGPKLAIEKAHISLKKELDIASGG